MNILIVEDNMYLASQISELFQKSIITNRVQVVYSYEQYISEISNLEAYDIVITDIMLSDAPAHNEKTGIDILRYIRSCNLKIPIIIISSLSACESLENAFRFWASDYIIKPFRLRELEIRINKWFLNYAISSHYQEDSRISYQEIEYNISQKEFFYQWEYLHLTKSEKYLLSLFVTHAETLLSQYFLIQKIRGDREYDYERNPRVNILRLKQSLRKYGISDWIQTVRGEGYILKRS